jgi:hypothetical protein
MVTNSHIPLCATRRDRNTYFYTFPDNIQGGGLLCSWGSILIMFILVSIVNYNLKVWTTPCLSAAKGLSNKNYILHGATLSTFEMNKRLL